MVIFPIMDMDPGRRLFLKGAGFAAAAYAVPNLLAACGAGNPSSPDTSSPSSPFNTVHPSATSPATAPAPPTPDRSKNKFGEPLKGIATSLSLLYETDANTKWMSPEGLEVRMRLIKHVLGAKAIRFGVDAAVLWASQEDFDANKITWDQYDLLIKTAEKFGIICLADFVGWPVPLGQPVCNRSFNCPPDAKYNEKYAGLIGAFAKRHQEVETYQDANEENSYPKNGGSKQNPLYYANPEAYARQFNLHRAVILDANPNAQVAVGALSGLSSNGAIDPAKFLRRAIKAGMTDFYALSINDYEDTVDYIKGDPSNPDTLAAVLGDTLLNRIYPGLKDIPVLITEFGANAPNPAYYAEQNRAIRAGLATNFGGLVTWRMAYQFVNSGDYFGLFTNGLEPKPAVDVFAHTPLGN